MEQNIWLFKSFMLYNFFSFRDLYGKFYIFVAVINEKMYFLAIVGLLATVIAAFYYLRIIKIIYFDPEKEKFESKHNLGLKFTLVASTFFILAYFIYPSGIVDIISQININ